MYNLEFSPHILKVLKSFNTINPSILFREGSQISTWTPKSHIVLATTVALTPTFQSEFAIYSLGDFLNTLSFFEKPTIEVHEKFLIISEGNRKVVFFFASPAMIDYPPQGEMKEFKSIAEFDLSEADLKYITKLTNVLKLPEITISARDGKLYVGASNSKSATSNLQEIDIADTDAVFNLIFKTEYINLMEGAYHVKVTDRTVIFEGPVKYYIAFESTSTI